MSRSAEVVNVFLNRADTKIKVGRLARKDKKIYFEYDKEFLKTGIELSPYKLPLREKLFTCENRIFDGLWGVFSDSLPDGWGKLLMDRYFKKEGLKDITSLDRLKYIGRYGMGALEYEPILKQDDLDLKDIALDDLAQSSQGILQGNSEELLEQLLSLNGSSAGARPKAMIQLDDTKTKTIHGAQDLQSGYTHWMVKFASSQDHSEIGAIEYAYSLMAKEAKIDMPDTALLHGENGSYFACKRFDRVKKSKVHVHTIAGLIDADFRYPSLDYDDLLSLTLHITKDINEQIKIFRLSCFNLFAHNRDDHAKNFSYILDEQNRWKLSPAYDLTFSNGPGGEHSTMYLGEGKNPTKEHLLKLAEKHNIKDGKLICEEVEEAVNNWSRFAKLAGASSDSIMS